MSCYTLLIIPLALILIIALSSPGTASAQEASPYRALPDVVHRGETFNVSVTFTSPSDNFQAVSLTEYAPAGWNVSVMASWSSPAASNVKGEGNKVEIAWQGPYQAGVNFTAVYQVTVPGNASPGNYTFDGHLGYWIGAANFTLKSVSGGNETEVVLPRIAVAPLSLAFGAVQGGLTPGNQTLFIWNSGDAGTTLNWNLSDDADWLEENVSSGCSTGEADKMAVEVAVNITGMGVGNYSANITITDPEAINSPVVVPVTLHISLPSSGGGGGGGGSSPATVRGDVNGDGEVDERDLATLRGIILGLDGVTASADVNGDGRIDVRDIVAIKRIIVRKG